MKSILTGIIILLISNNLIGQNLDCNKFKNGHFKILKDSTSEESFIERDENFQTEKINGKAEYSKFHVNWVSACIYTLTPTKKTLLQYKGLPKNAMLTVEIIETKENSYIQKSTANFADFDNITEVIKIENIHIEIQNKESLLNDTIRGQLKTAERLKSYMSDMNYEDAILLFSVKQQKNIKEIQTNKEIFEYWCMAWTFDDAKYERYVAKIKEGKAYFIFENNEWKINEK